MAMKWGFLGMYYCSILYLIHQDMSNIYGLVNMK
jgi:hypothetical protein